MRVGERVMVCFKLTPCIVAVMAPDPNYSSHLPAISTTYSQPLEVRHTNT
jgi:hypothetical protein